MIFANSRTFAESVRGLVDARPGLNRIIVAAEPITDVDTTASDMLQELHGWLAERGVSMVFAEMKDPVRAKIERYELGRTLGSDRHFPTVDEAVSRYVSETGASWQTPGADH